MLSLLENSFLPRKASSNRKPHVDFANADQASTFVMNENVNFYFLEYFVIKKRAYALHEM